jgi:hypothetical protein
MGCHAGIILWHVRRFSQGFDGSRTVRAPVRLRRREGGRLSSVSFLARSLLTLRFGVDTLLQECSSGDTRRGEWVPRGLQSLSHQGLPGNLIQSSMSKRGRENSKYCATYGEQSPSFEKQVVYSGATLYKNETAFISRRGRTCEWHGCGSLRPRDRIA